MGKLAFLFPGQGSQYPGMGRELAANHSAARSVFDEADQALGFSVSDLCFNGSEEALKLTANTQPAILTTSVATYRVLAENGVQPAFVAGHSLGEFSALVAAGGLEFADAVRIVRRRGEYMQSAVPEGVGVAPANLNSPEQTVISGHAEAVKRAVELASAGGAKRAVMLTVSAPFHSSLMQPAAVRLEADLGTIAFHTLRVPLVNNADAEITTSGDEARESLIRQVTLPVRWEESVRELIDQGVNTFVEVGPGRVLTGLLRQIDRSIHVFNVEDEKSLRSTLERLAQAQTESAEA